MAQTIQIANATYPDVPSIVCNKQGGGTAVFADPSGTTAVAADVAQGKLFLNSSGVLTQGTASGGGGTLKMGVIRPDATLVKKWTYNKLIVQDEGKTIPSYSTSNQTLIASTSTTAVAEGLSIDLDAYVYFILYRCLSSPVYNTPTPVTGREEFYVNTHAYEYFKIPSGIFKAASGKAFSPPALITSYNSFTRLFYWSSASNVNTYYNSSNAYGANQSVTTPTTTSNLTIYFPALRLRGSGTYFPQAVWNTVTDIRYQYIVELYRVPQTSTDVTGWVHTMQPIHIANCINNGGTLT